MLTIILTLLAALFTSSNAPKEPFMKAFGGDGPDRGIHIIQASDGNLVIVGNTMTESSKLDVIS